ncbi:GNAT family N-acetyltransferase [Rhodospirillum rubrum]|uniref:GCN5-related N-acetyltransferase n=1 Tax=Rhodospirillum rubrum (strain ATCC 11170 / ATH 1.1.1 / DSM 467 / LMG 4362 / NCIMB 8255 / S1) TaxID=269796 RepID=Q2RS68_RHORT|nr:GNAT family N-acetyltransferase [Rhodospirillum rubrum]ABC23027.1 GCN5-related N-acetyltransferase [Rhodospirillum rubrum ATCC 11170]AEO48756.1 GCN5-related N-acetyltransferase [Rhodospirillum rubrum F11]MBK5954655.1 N-acetyltransferase [Rhodospirillum rubrum]QXG79011.1 GNAT family N-acetyltransferase [Rhodospirillum rubrum]HAQ01232.1 N-acetyltransferase [Rhodospirillum rubrum]
MDPIQTDRLILRNFKQGDAADLLAYLHQPRVSCFLSLKLEDLGAAEAEVKTRSTSDEHIAVCLRTPDKLIGDMFCMAEPPDTYSVGWNFNADFQGAGLASEAARALFEYLFTVKEARRLYAFVEEDNLPSRRLCERLGMRKEGLFKEFISFRTDDEGVPVFENTMQYALLRKEWVA